MSEPRTPPHEDTPQQRAALRASSAARAVRSRFPRGTRVTSRDVETGLWGTVARHVPMTNAQGGTLVVDWDSGRTGRTGAISLRREEEGTGD